MHHQHTHTPASTPPQPEPALLQRAFELMRWRGWTLEQAMADPIRSRVLRGCAACLKHRRHITDLKRAAAGDCDARF